MRSALSMRWAVKKNAKHSRPKCGQQSRQLPRLHANLQAMNGRSSKSSANQRGPFDTTIPAPEYKRATGWSWCESIEVTGRTGDYTETEHPIRKRREPASTRRSKRLRRTKRRKSSPHRADHGEVRITAIPNRKTAAQMRKRNNYEARAARTSLWLRSN
jgi:hypothetical protein